MNHFFKIIILRSFVDVTYVSLRYIVDHIAVFRNVVHKNSKKKKNYIRIQIESYSVRIVIYFHGSRMRV